MQPKSFSELLGQSWDMYTDQFNVFLALVLLLTFPFQVLLAVTEQYDHSSVAIYFNGGLGVAAWVVSIWFSIALVVTVDRAQKKEPVTVKSVLHDAQSLWLDTLGTTLVTGLLLGVLFLALIIPGIVFAVYWAFILPAVVLMGKKYGAARQYSRALVKGRWWEVFVRFLGLVIIVGIPILAIVIPTLTISDQFNLIIQPIVNTLIQVIAVYATIFMVMYFFDLQAHLADKKS